MLLIFRWTYFVLLIFPILVQAFEVKISGNEKTHPDVILVEIQDLRDQKLTQEIQKEIERRLWNLEIFTKVSTKIIGEIIEIVVESRWTLIPIARVGGGGGSTFYAVGAYDKNLLGDFLEMGVQYESLNQRPAGVTWLRKPQFLRDRNLRFGMDLWTINRVRYFFTREGKDNGAFTLQRRRGNFFLEKKWDNDFYLFGMQFDYHQDQITDFGLTDEQVAKNQANNFTPDENSINRWYGLYFSIGRLNYKNYLQYGNRFRISSRLVHTGNGDERYFTSHTMSYKHYWLFEKNQNLAWQILVSGNNSERIQYQNYLGGLGEVRGYRDGQFYAQTYWQSNLEHRFDMFEHPWMVLQGVVFTDVAKEGHTLEAIGDNDDEVMLSSGFGVRFISPKIYRFVGRLDFAQTHTRNIDRSIAFGIQQFF